MKYLSIGYIQYENKSSYGIFHEEWDPEPCPQISFSPPYEVIDLHSILNKDSKLMSDKEKKFIEGNRLYMMMIHSLIYKLLELNDCLKSFDDDLTAGGTYIPYADELAQLQIDHNWICEKIDKVTIYFMFILIYEFIYLIVNL